MPRTPFLEITDRASGLTFRFYFDRLDPSRLHIEAAHRVSIEEAIGTFFDRTATTVRVESRRCFETITDTHLLAWLWLDAAQTRVLVITCLRPAEA